MKLEMTIGEVSKKLAEFFINNGATSVPTEWGRCFANYHVATWRWGEHIEDGYLRSNAMHVKMSYLPNVVFLISVRSGAGWVPNTKDREYILNYFKPLADSLGFGEPEEIYTKSVGTRSSNANILNLRWCDEDFESLIAAITHVFDE